MEDAQFDAIMDYFEDAKWVNGMWVYHTSLWHNFEIICKFNGFPTMDTFDIDQWRQTFKDEGVEDWSLQFFSSITR